MPLRRISPRTGTVLAAAAAIALATTVLALTTCSNDDANNGATDPSESTSTTASVETEVEAAYMAFWEMFVRLAEAPNPDDSEIAERASGEARQNVVDGLSAMRSLDQRSVFGPEYTHNVLTIELQDQSTAVLEDCAVDDSRLVNASTGETIREAIVTEHLRVSMIYESGQWLVSETSRLNSWDGAVPCG